MKIQSYFLIGLLISAPQTSKASFFVEAMQSLKNERARMTNYFRSLIFHKKNKIFIPPQVPDRHTDLDSVLLNRADKKGLQYLNGFIRNFHIYETDPLTSNDIQKANEAYTFMHDAKSLEQKLCEIVQKNKNNESYVLYNSIHEFLENIADGFGCWVYLNHGQDSLNDFAQNASSTFQNFLNRTETILLKWLPQAQATGLLAFLQTAPASAELGDPVLQMCEYDRFCGGGNHDLDIFFDNPRLSSLKALKTTCPRYFDPFPDGAGLIFRPTSLMLCGACCPTVWECAYGGLIRQVRNLDSETWRLEESIRTLSNIYYRITKNKNMELIYKTRAYLFQKNTYAQDILNLYERNCCLEKQCYAWAVNIWKILRDKEQMNSAEWIECNDMVQKFEQKICSLKKNRSQNMQTFIQGALNRLDNLSEQEKRYYPSLSQQIRILNNKSTELAQQS